MKQRSCWLCGRNGNADPLDRHHIFGGARRKLSEKYGLVVDLCHHDCHLFGAEAAHRSRETMQALHEYGQRLCMERHGMSREEFMLIFGKNYLPAEEPEREPVAMGGGFCEVAAVLPF